MKLFGEWKIKRECLKNGRKKEYDEYKKVKEAIIKEKQIHEECLKRAEERFEKIKKVYGPSSREYIKASEDVNRWHYCIAKDKLELEFMRPNTLEDIEYRKQIIDRFRDEIGKILSGDNSVRFHGTSIYFAREILKEGEVSSTKVRFDGYDNSISNEDEFCVTTADKIEQTLSFFSDFYAFSNCLPAGCVFVLRATSEDEELAKYAVMKSFKFREHPERILGICTTPENVSKVKKWLKQYGYDEGLVYDYDQFLDVAPSLKSKDIVSIPEKSDRDTVVSSEDVSALGNVDLFDELVDTFEDPNIVESFENDNEGKRKSM